MKDGNTILKGTVRGKTIELEQESGLPDGQLVVVTLIPSSPSTRGLRRAFGAWAGDAAGLDEFVEQMRDERKRQRNALAP